MNAYVVKLRTTRVVGSKDRHGQDQCGGLCDGQSRSPASQMDAVG
jgi:hypothetical protein